MHRILVNVRSGEQTFVSLTDEEIAALLPNAENAALQLAEEIRSQRDALLRQCDWTQLADAPVNSLDWAVYRQALRDVPEQAGFPSNVIWPTPPVS